MGTSQPQPVVDDVVVAGAHATASRFGRGAGRGGKNRSVDIAAACAAQPLSAFFFDLLHLDGVDLLDRPASERLAALDAIVPATHRVDRLTTSDAGAAQRFLDVTLLPAMRA